MEKPRRTIMTDEYATIQEIAPRFLAADLEKTVIQAAEPGNAAGRRAFGRIVDRFQDMAYGYAYGVLGDHHLAQDAAQDAFVTAWTRLGSLRDPQAFPGWFRRIVRSQCSRLVESRRSALPLEEARGATAPDSLEETALQS